MAIGTVAMLVGASREKKNTKKLRNELANAPKYKITDEAFENQAIAKSEAYGRDRSIQMQEQNISQEAANAAGQARDVTSSTSALLNTISQINAAKTQGLRGLAQDEAGLMNQKKQQLMGANNAMIDEKDKAWNYNENMPFQMRVAMYRDKIKSNQEAQMAGLAYEGQTVSAFASMMGSMGGACDERLKENIAVCEPGLDAVMEMRPVTFDYTHPRFADGRKHIGFIAQEIQQIIPEAVDKIHGLAPEGEPDFLKINYNELVPVLVNAIKDLNKKIEELEAKVQRTELNNSLIGTSN